MLEGVYQPPHSCHLVPWRPRSCAWQRKSLPVSRCLWCNGVRFSFSTQWPNIIWLVPHVNLRTLESSIPLSFHWTLVDWMGSMIDRKNTNNQCSPPVVTVARAELPIQALTSQLSFHSSVITSLVLAGAVPVEMMWTILRLRLLNIRCENL